MEACSLLVNLRKGMQSSSEQPLVGEEYCVTTRITAAKETKAKSADRQFISPFQEKSVVSSSVAGRVSEFDLCTLSTFS